MAFVNAQQTRASIGLLNASGYIRQLATTLATDPLDVTTLVDRAKVFIVGQTSGEGSIDMVLDTLPATNSQFAVLNTWKSTQPTPLDVAPEGYATGNPVIMFNAIQTQATTQAAVAGTADASVQFIASDEAEVGVSVEDYTQISGTGNGTARDSGIAGGTTNGGVAHLHVSQYASITSDTITIEHSVDGSTSWAVLVTFTAATGLTSQRVVVAAGTTVRKFLRVVDTFSGAGTITRQVSFARR